MKLQKKVIYLVGFLIKLSTLIRCPNDFKEKSPLEHSELVILQYIYYNYLIGYIILII